MDNAALPPTETTVQHDLGLLERRWGLALLSAQFGVWDLDVASQRVHYSPQWKSTLGYGESDEHDSTDTWRSRVHPDDLASMLAAQVAHIDGRAPAYEVEFRITDAHGRYHWVLSRGRVVERDAAGAATRMVGTLTDLTDRKEAEGLRVARDRAEADTRAQQQFLSRMSHELRTPLNAVLGFAQLLTHQIGSGDVGEQRRYAAHIADAGWQLLTMIDNVLDITHMQRDQLTLDLQTVALAPLVHTACDTMGPLARTRAVAIRFSGEPADALVVADPGRLAQVLRSLLSNAVLYNRHGGAVDVDIVPGDERVQFTITDTGPGIAERDMPQLFEPFNRLGREHSGTAGVGLGLVLARWLVQAMGGGLDARSVEGQGSTFAVSLPRVVPAG